MFGKQGHCPLCLKYKNRAHRENPHFARRSTVGGFLIRFPAILLALGVLLHPRPNISYIYGERGHPGVS